MQRVTDVERAMVAMTARVAMEVKSETNIVRAAKEEMMAEMEKGMEMEGEKGDNGRGSDGGRDDWDFSIFNLFLFYPQW